MRRDLRAYGVVGRFETPELLLQATAGAKDAGYTKLDAYTPFPVHGLGDALSAEDARLPWFVFLCGVAGAAGGFALQYLASVVAYPLNVGGRPLFSWPSFLPVTFETTVLLAAFGAVVGMFALNGLPRPHHPIFETPGFERASTDGFFLCVEAVDPRYDAERIRTLLLQLGAAEATEIDQ